MTPTAAPEFPPFCLALFQADPQRFSLCGRPLGHEGGHETRTPPSAPSNDRKPNGRSAQ